MIGRKSKLSIGVDIGTYSIKLVILEKKGKKIRLLFKDQERLPPDSIVGKEIMDRQAVVEALESIFSRAEAPLKDVTVSIAGRGVILKKITVPFVKDVELRQSIEWQVRESIPFDLTDISWDYFVIERDKTRGEIDVLIAAAKNESIYNIIDLVKSAGLNPIAIDLEPLAWLNTLLYLEGEGDGEERAIMNIGYDITGILLTKNGKYENHREIPIATKVYIEALTRFLDLDEDRAKDVLKGELEGVEREDVERIIGSINEKLTEHMERLFTFLTSEEGEGTKINRIMLGGGGATILGFSEYLSERYKIPVEILNPFQGMEMEFEIDERETPIYLTATGLALRNILKDSVRLNLLPTEEKKIEKKQILSFVEAGVALLPVVLVLAFSITSQMRIKKKIKAVSTELKQIKEEERGLKSKIKELELLEKRKKDIGSKIAIIDGLSKGRYVPVTLLDEINRLVPDGLWLTRLDAVPENEGVFDVKVKGATFSMFRVADFLSNLMSSPYISKVELQRAGKEGMEGDITGFEIGFKFESK